MTKNKKIKICVTGYSGFIGSRLANYAKGIEHVELVPFKGDLLSKEDIALFFGENKDIDQIIHLVGAFSGTLGDLVNINVVALGNLLEAAVAEGIKKIIYTSTGAVYGEPVGTASKEDDPLNPNTLYGLSKKYAEECLLYYSKNHSIDFVVLRFPNVYGGGSTKGVVYNFLTDIEEKGEITVFGDGEQSRNFLHVQDACKAIMLAVDYRGSGIFNISNPGKTSINDLIQLLSKKYDFSVNYKPGNNNLKDLLLDIAKAKKELGFMPEIRGIRLEK